MTGTAERDQVLWLVAAATLARQDVADFEETGATAAWHCAAVFVAGEDLAAGARRDGGSVAAAVLANGCVAMHSFAVGPAQLALAGFSLDGHSARRDIMVNVDLHGRP